MAPPEVTGRKPAGSPQAVPAPPTSPRASSATNGFRLISYKDLKPLKGIPYSRTDIRRKEALGLFPEHVVLGEGAHPLIAWVEAEIDAYIEEKMQARRAPAAGIVPVGVARCSVPDVEDAR
jgi:predicted DNA-binding transcriptional regulator AlpA